MNTDSDGEFGAMRSIADVLEPLDEDTRRRVLSWANQKFPNAASVPPPERRATADISSQDFPDLYGAADPQTEEERVLVAAYWTTKHNGIQDMDAMSLNTLLKDLGYPVGNITRALSRLQSQRPTLVRQVLKAGSTKQARKKYRITSEGIRAVEDMFAGRHLPTQE